jgi:hypothetical protein
MAYQRSEDLTSAEAQQRQTQMEGMGGRSMGTLKSEVKFEPVIETEEYQEKQGGRIHRGFKSKYVTKTREVRRPDKAVFDYAYGGPKQNLGFSNEAAVALDRSFDPGITSTGLTGVASDKSMNQMGSTTSAAPMAQGQTSIGMTGSSSEQSLNEQIDEIARQS